MENLHELNQKLSVLTEYGAKEYPACQDIGSLLAKLKIKVGI